MEAKPSTEQTAADTTKKPDAASTTDAKPKEGETLLTDKDKKPEAKAEGAPEKYEAFKLPDGVELNEKALGEAQAVFKEMGLSQDAAQKLVDFHTAQMKAAVEAPAKALTDMRADWQKKTVENPALGDGKALRPEVKAAVSKAIDSLGPKLAADFRSAMDLTGVGDNPAFVEAFYEFAKDRAEGKAVRGGGPSGEGQKGPTDKPKSAANALYPNLT